MSRRIRRAASKPNRKGLSWRKLWEGPDKGLILCWETGRELGRRHPDLAERAKKGELPVLEWKGGVGTKTKKGEKHGALFYLAQWQGLRGEDLDIDPSVETELVCARTGMKVICTADVRKYGNA